MGGEKGGGRKCNRLLMLVEDRKSAGDARTIKGGPDERGEEGRGHKSCWGQHLHMICVFFDKGC